MRKIILMRQKIIRLILPWMIAVLGMPIFSCWGLQNNCLLHNFAQMGLSDLLQYICIVLFICKYKTLSPNHKTLGSFFMFFSTQPSWFWGYQTPMIITNQESSWAPSLNKSKAWDHVSWQGSAKHKNHLNASPQKQTVARKSHHLSFFSFLSFFRCLFACTCLRTESFSKMVSYSKGEVKASLQNRLVGSINLMDSFHYYLYA